MARSAFSRREFLKVALAGAGASLLAACTPAPAAPPTAVPAAKPAAQPTTAPAVQPTAAPAVQPTAAAKPAAPAAAPAKVAVPKNAIVKAIKSDATSADPAVATDLPGRVPIANCYDALMRYEGFPPKAVPNLAESIQASPDAKTYTVKLRSGIKFHDGSDLDAAAVVFSMDRMLNMNKGPAANFKAQLNPGDSKAVDKLTVQFNLKTPSAVFPAQLPFFFVVNPKLVNANKAASGAYGANGDFAEQWLQTHDAGSGPYMMKSRTPNSEIVMEGFPDYFRGWKENQYGTYTFKVVPDDSPASLMIKQNQVDMIYEYYAPNVMNDLATAQNITVRSDLFVKPCFLYMNNQKAPTDNPKVRQAIAYAMDYEGLIKDVMAPVPGTQRLPGPLPRGTWGALDKPAYETNLDRARSLLAETGLKAADLKLQFSTYGGPADSRVKTALMTQAILSKIGVDVEIQMSSWGEQVQQFRQADTTRHLYAIYQTYDYVDPDALMYPNYHSSSHGTWAGSMWYKNAQVDQLIDKGRTTLGEDSRLTIYKQIQDLIVADCPCAFLWNEPVRVAALKSVGGWVYGIGPFNYYMYRLFKQA